MERLCCRKSLIRPLFKPPNFGKPVHNRCIQVFKLAPIRNLHCALIRKQFRIQTFFVKYNSLSYSTSEKSAENLTESTCTEDISSHEDEDFEQNYGEDENSYLEYFINKAQQDVELSDIEYKDIKALDQKLYYQIIDVWIKEAGDTKRGHRDFINVLLKNMKKFRVQFDAKAYLKLLECFPDGEHTGIKRDKIWQKDFQDKRPDHVLGVEIFKTMYYVGAQPTDALFDKSLQLFGRYSIATKQIRALLFWSSRLQNFNHTPHTLGDILHMSPFEIAFRGLKQMNPGLDTLYDKISDGNCDLISSQTPKQLKLLQKHNPTTSIYIEGPNLSYFYGKKVFYFKMYRDPENQVKEKENRLQTTLLTDKEWWTKHYEVDWSTGKKMIDGKYYPDDENVLPVLNMEEDIGVYKNKIKEVETIEQDTQTVEGSVYAIASTTDNYVSLPLLKQWLTQLQSHNPILSQVTVLFRDKETFLTSDNESRPEKK